MKRIIKGRKYDTETAKAIGQYEFDYPTSIHYYSETLYKKRNGEFFIFGNGGPGSKYSEYRYGGSWAGTGRITPMSYENARFWAEEHLNADTYESIFGEVLEGAEDHTMLSVRISPKAKGILERLASKTGKSKGELVSQALEALAAETR